MARESRRKREERRFGKPERIVDMLAEIGPQTLGFPPWTTADSGITADMVRGYVNDLTQVADAARMATVVQADNVADYFFGPREFHGFHWDRDVPSLAPPFDSVFVDIKASACIISRNLPRRWGALIAWHDTWRGDGERPAERTEPRWITQIHLLTQIGERVAFLGFVVANVDSRGRTEETPVCYPSLIVADGETPKDEIYDISLLLAPSALAISFMHCKNVMLRANEPDAALNRERKKAGRKPFLRYHTINIEPMKTVLRTEGGIEENGLKKALHICRGHFATYTEDKPLFGRTVGTVWRPSHTRGSYKSGVVVSDYRVHAPATQETHQ